ncbi:CRISPR-associated protein, Csh1 family [Methanosarcina mazei Tuc01]|uniref:CRISPR-associated protein, Csh1 family n=1 Tax=Methanosarcina mazei Tuc01 TaxID=1236903 RepID=M1P6J1_METMZ|nr:CRISPR-associated protein, Csh1 family [Methanosarcina mazei Tuc01]
MSKYKHDYFEGYENMFMRGYSMVKYEDLEEFFDVFAWPSLREDDTGV